MDSLGNDPNTVLRKGMTWFSRTPSLMEIPPEITFDPGIEWPAFSLWRDHKGTGPGGIVFRSPAKYKEILEFLPLWRSFPSQIEETEPSLLEPELRLEFYDAMHRRIVGASVLDAGLVWCLEENWTNYEAAANTLLDVSRAKDDN